MSTLSEQDHLNPRDPRYYAPRWLRERAGSSPLPDVTSAKPFSPASFDAELEGAVSNALRHPLDPEVMHGTGYDVEQRGALRSVGIRFAAAIGVSALVALFFVVAVPASRQADTEATASPGIIQSIKAALFKPAEAESEQAIASSPAPSEFQTLMASAQASTPPAQNQSGQLLKQFMQWREKPSTATP